MKSVIFRFFFCLVVLSCSQIFGQSYKFAWLTDLHIGAAGADSALLSCVESINAQDKIAFVVVTGNISEKGKNAELEQAKEILDSLKVKYYIIPGSHDTRWSESLGSEFRRLWGDTKFCFEEKSAKFIGLNTGILWCGGGGHIDPEDMAWLDSVMINTPSKQKVVFLSSNPMNGEVDNWFDAINALAKGNIRLLLNGGAHDNRQSEIAGIPSFTSRPVFKQGETPGYTVASVFKDSILFSEMLTDNSVHDWGAAALSEKYAVGTIDSTGFDNYMVEFNWMIELKKTITAPVTVANNKIFASTAAGDIFCFDMKGNTLWNVQAHAPVSGQIAIAQATGVVATIDGDILTFDAETGKLIQSIGTGEALTSSPLIIKIPYQNDEAQAVIVGTAGGKLLCFELSSLTLIWENKNAAGMIQRSPVLIKDRLIYGSWDGSLYCIDKTSGALNWKWNESKSFYYAPAGCMPQVNESGVYICTPDKFVSKIDLLLGKTLWRKKDFDASESIGMSKDKKQLYIKSQSNKFYSVNAADGKKIKEWNLKYGFDTTPIEPLALEDGAMLGTKNGYVFKVSSSGIQILFYMGAARIHNIVQSGANSFIASNMDGKIVSFSLQEAQ